MEGLTGHYESGKRRHLEAYDGSVALQGGDLVRDITRHTRRIAEIYKDEEMTGRLNLLLDGVDEEGATLNFVVTGEAQDEFYDHYPEGTRISATGIGLVVVRYPQMHEVAVAPLDGGARLVGEFYRLEPIEAPLEDDVAHVIADLPCERCDRGDHDMNMAPALQLVNARIESLDGGVVMEFDEGELVYAPLGYESLSFGRVCS